jgi:hypothetical protein
VSLFTATELRPRKSRLRARPRKTIQIPTGALRLGESSADRRSRMRSEAWASFADAIARSALARLDLLSGCDQSDAVACPWAQIYPDDRCPQTCRCGGTAKITAGFLVVHYQQLAAEFGGAS